MGSGILLVLVWAMVSEWCFSCVGSCVLWDREGRKGQRGGNLDALYELVSTFIVIGKNLVWGSIRLHSCGKKGMGNLASMFLHGGVVLWYQIGLLWVLLINFFKI